MCEFLSDNHQQSLEFTTGVRCHGTNVGFSIYPVYTWERAFATGAFRTKCSDKSDSIFQRNKSCPAPATGVDYSTRHINLFPELTRDLSSIEFNTLMTRIDEDRDPHDCKSSCQAPGPGCAACTHPEYFPCRARPEALLWHDGGPDPELEVCLHPQLVCDGVPQCQHGEDERGCLERYRERGVVSKYATYQCIRKDFKGSKVM